MGNNNLESAPSVINGFEKPERNYVELNDKFKEQCDQCKSRTNEQEKNILEKYLGIPQEVSDDGKDELAKREGQIKKDFEEDLKEPKNLGEKFFAKMEKLTSPQEVKNPNSADLNVASQKRNMSIFERSEGILTGNKEAPDESINVGSEQTRVV